MNLPKQNKEQLDERNAGIDQAALEAYVRKQLNEKVERQTSSSVKLESLRIIGDTLIIFVLGLFIVSPLLQLFLRVINDSGAHSRNTIIEEIQYYQWTVQYYQWTIKSINYVARFTTVFIFLLLIIYSVMRRKEGVLPLEKTDKKQLFKRLIPLIVFGLFALDIALVTIIRGTGEYDLTGHPYMYESVYSYISYTLVFFFCGVMLYREKYKKVLIYTLIFTSIPVNILAYVNTLSNGVRCFIGKDLCAIFHNANHYGYYLAITIVASALIFVYEKNLILKTVAALSASLDTILLIMNNTLGSYLAVLFVLILFVIYCFFIVKRDKRQSVLILGIFLLVTLLMSFVFDTIISSFIKMFTDIEMIVSDPLEADSAGTTRWALWKGTVQHIPESPWTGFGVEGMLDKYRIGTPHNEFLQYAAFFGIPASVLYITACCMILIKTFMAHKEMSSTTMVCFFVSLCYLASSFFGVAIYYTTPFIYIFLGLTYAEYLHGKA